MYSSKYQAIDVLQGIPAGSQGTGGLDDIGMQASFPSESRNKGKGKVLKTEHVNKES